MKKLSLLIFCMAPWFVQAQWQNSGSVTYLSNASYKVGINTTTPASKLEIVGPGSTLTDLLNLKNNDISNLKVISAGATVNYGANFYSMRSKNTVSSPGAVSAYDYVGGWFGSAYINGDYRDIAAVKFSVGAGPSTSVYPGEITFHTSNGTGSPLIRMTIKQSGEVGIGKTPTSGNKLDVGGNVTIDGNTNVYGNIISNGSVSSQTLAIASTTIPSGYTLAVGGKTITEEVVVKLKTNWPDYVFADNYNVMPLFELEKFIKSHKHLPEVPAAKEITENGVALGDMNATLLKKIEELTLYVIELKKENEEQQKVINAILNKQ